MGKRQREEKETKWEKSERRSQEVESAEATSAQIRAAETRHETYVFFFEGGWIRPHLLPRWRYSKRCCC